MMDLSTRLYLPNNPVNEIHLMIISNRVKRNISFTLMLVGVACIIARTVGVITDPHSGKAWLGLCAMLLLTYCCFDSFLIYRRRIKDNILFGSKQILNTSMNYTPERITTLKPDEIFVFGSNLAGMHGGGAARIAHMRFGAKMGQGVGLQGQSYAIPTMQGGVETIRPYVDEFIEFAKSHSQLTFLVTRIGCGIAGFRDEDIAPLFKQAVEVKNIILPKSFAGILNS